MANSIASYLVNDLYAPLTPKPSLQQYDNYQIYDMYCIDIDTNIDRTKNGSTVNTIDTSKQNSWLAVQSYSISPILCNFELIAEAYP